MQSSISTAGIYCGELLTITVLLPKSSTSLVEDEKTNTESITDKSPIVSPKEVNVIVSEESIEKSKEPVLVNDNQTSIKYIGEAFDTYIIAEKNNKDILLIDKQAAHERIIYEKLKAEKAADYRQILLAPVTVPLGKNEYDAACLSIKRISLLFFSAMIYVSKASPIYLMLV